MYSIQALLLTGLICFIAGITASLLWNLRFSTKQQRARDLEKHLHDKQDEIKSYQREVTEHFTETSTLLKQLAESYKDIHNHLATGAEKLSNSGHAGAAPIIEKLINTEAPKTEELTDVQAPLDYAPKSTPYDRSTLNEEFGLEKVELTEKPVEHIADYIAEKAKQS